jgi:hypothetical protein
MSCNVQYLVVQVLFLYVVIIHGCRCTMDHTTLEMRTVPHNNVPFSMSSTLNDNLREVRSIQYLREDIRAT